MIRSFLKWPPVVLRFVRLFAVTVSAMEPPVILKKVRLLIVMVEAKEPPVTCKVALS